MDPADMTRRGVIGAGAAMVALPTMAAGRGTVSLVVGTYVAKGGAGLYPVAFDAAADRWSVAPAIAGIDDASFGVRGGPGGAMYLLRERGAGEVAAYAPGWSRRGVAGTGGADPCHAAIDPGSGCLAVANYSSGSVAFYRLDRRTGVPAVPTVFRHTGSGPDRARQAAPHAHWVGFSPDRRWLHAVDLGADAVFAYRFDPAARTLAGPVVAWRAPAGAGPRHLARHPHRRVAYVVCELANTLIMLDARDDGRFVTRVQVSTLPAGFAGASQAAHIVIDRAGRRLYVSNRGHDSIAVFALDEAGVPVPVGHVPSGGHWPRFFLLLEAEQRMVVANERSGTLAILALSADGMPVPTDRRLAVPGAVFIHRVG